MANEGSRATRVGTWLDRVYISQDPSLDFYDEILGSVRHDGVLGTGQTYTTTATVRLPDNIEGDFYILVYTDSPVDRPAWGGTPLPYPIAKGPHRLEPQHAVDPGLLGRRRVPLGRRGVGPGRPADRQGGPGEPAHRRPRSDLEVALARRSLHGRAHGHAPHGTPRLLPGDRPGRRLRRRALGRPGAGPEPRRRALGGWVHLRFRQPRLRRADRQRRDLSGAEAPAGRGPGFPERAGPVRAGVAGQPGRFRQGRGLDPRGPAARLQSRRPLLPPGRRGAGRPARTRPQRPGLVRRAVRFRRRAGLCAQRRGRGGRGDPHCDVGLHGDRSGDRPASDRSDARPAPARLPAGRRSAFQTVLEPLSATAFAWDFRGSGKSIAHQTGGSSRNSSHLLC